MGSQATDKQIAFLCKRGWRYLDAAKLSKTEGIVEISRLINGEDRANEMRKEVDAGREKWKAEQIIVENEKRISPKKKKSK